MPQAAKSGTLLGKALKKKEIAASEIEARSYKVP